MSVQLENVLESAKELVVTRVLCCIRARSADDSADKGSTDTFIDAVNQALYGAPGQNSRKSLWIEFLLLCRAMPDTIRQILAITIREHDQRRVELEVKHETANANWTRIVVSDQDSNNIEGVMRKCREVEEELLLCRQKLMVWRLHKSILENTLRWLNAVKLDDCEVGWKELRLLSRLSEEYIEKKWRGLMEEAPTWDWVDHA